MISSVEPAGYITPLTSAMRMPTPIMRRLISRASADTTLGLANVDRRGAVAPSMVFIENQKAGRKSNELPRYRAVTGMTDPAAPLPVYFTRAPASLNRSRSSER